MSIPMDTYCYQCHMRRYLEIARSLGDEDTATAFLKEMMKVYLTMPADASSTAIQPEMAELLKRFYNLGPDRYRQEKEDSNRFVMERMEDIRKRVNSAKDPLFAALQFAVLGNYIDFSALQGQISFAELEKMLDNARNMELDQDAYAHLRKDLAEGKRLLYITDNAGEICFDRIFAEEIKKTFPHVEITVCVRGGPASNDATREDAQAVGIPFPVIDNGTSIGGTELHRIGKQAKDALEAADVIIAKGMGNTETMLGCGYNVYYAFLVKCDRFISYFKKPKMTPMLVRERAER